MFTLIEQVNHGSTAWTALMFAIVWQSTLLAAAIAAVAWMLRHGSPGVRYWLWQIVAIKLLVMPLWTMTLGVPWPTGELSQATVVTQPAAPAVDATRPAPGSRSNAALAASTDTAMSLVGAESRGRLAWQSWLLLAWAAIVVFQIVLIGMQRFRLSRMLRACDPAADELTETIESVAERLNLRKLPAVLLTDEACSPLVCGVLRPKLVLPRRLLTPGEIAQVIAHELAHIKRHDLAWGWTAQLARTLFFFHPVAHLVAGRIRLERELACDQLAMCTTGHSAGEYVKTLVRIVGQISEPRVASAAVALDGSEPFSAR